MPRQTCKTCRRLGVSVCGREKCALKRKPYPPGIHGNSGAGKGGKGGRRRGAGSSEYGIQLREKQKVKFLYGLRERQFSNYVLKAVKQHKISTGEAIVLSLEKRLDNAVFRAGFAPSRSAARQMVSHGHISVNNRRASVPSFGLKVGDAIGITQKSRSGKLFTDLELKIKKYNPPEWLELDKQAFSAKIVSQPSAQELIKAYNISAIVEYYSR